jgi:phosphate/sulfate permease
LIGPRHQDDRGKPVRLLPLGSHSRQAGGWNWFFRDVARRTWQSRGIVGIAAGIALAGVFMVAWTHVRDVLPLLFFSPIGSTLVVLLAVSLLSVGHAWRAWPDWVRETHLRQQTCPVCRYGLSGQVLQPDGCVVCPECASAWNVADEMAMTLPRDVVIVSEETPQNHAAERSDPPMITREISDEPNSYAKAR